MALSRMSRWATLVVAVASLVEGGCGLILQGPNQTVRIRSNPEGADVTFAGTSATTPGQVTARRLREGAVLRASKPKYQPVCNVVQMQGSWLLITLDSIPAALGLLVDKLAGTWPGQYPSDLEVTLSPAGDLDEPFTLPSDAQIMAAYKSHQRDLCPAPEPLQVWEAWYGVSMVSVDRPSQPAQRYGRVERVGKIAREGRDLPKFGYSDSNITLTVLPVEDGVEFELENLTSHAEKIIWDEVAFVDFDKSSHRVIHEGVRYIDRNLSQPPSVVAPRNLLRDKIIPVNRVEQGSVGFVHEPLLGISARRCDESEESFRARAEKAKGAPFSVLLPVDIAGTVNEYMLNFQIDATQLKSARGCHPRMIREQEVIQRGKW